MIDAENGLSVRTQCELVQVQRSGYYYQSKKQCGEDGKIMNEIYEIWLARPYYGYRRITRQLREEGHKVNRKRGGVPLAAANESPSDLSETAFEYGKPRT